ncbi:MAG: IF-2-associated domain-containing protein, partial [Rhodobacteraceae bacterium]|nr:IF-2-associated domain-containing protein [Paracoccaceae bacterium]
MDTKDSDRKGKTLGPRGGTETSHVRQSFSHGRSKSVTVEHKRKRVVVPKPGAAASGAGQSPRNAMGQNLSDAEFERRLKAVEAAKAQEAERQAKEREAAEAREAELGRLRAEKDAAERAAREREI